MKIITITQRQLNKQHDSGKSFYDFFQLNPVKGLLFRGDPGVGKTTAMRKILSGTRSVELSAESINKMYMGFWSQSKIEAHQHPLAWRMDYSLFIDDLGAEEPQINVMGTITRPIKDLLGERYNIFIKRGIKDYLTTNLELDEISKIYTARISSRLCEMCNIIELEGIDYRQNEE